MKTTASIRQAFIDFFVDRGHHPVASSSLVPGNDPTLLFTNAGMVQFKDVFLGAEARDYRRAVSSQRCVRAGGKHNDLENVGYTARHHTFFEMLGNFSFGDYFKQEAIEYAWAFLTKECGLPAERLWVTVFEEDDEAASIWLDHIGVDPSRFSRIGAKDNFWAMGDTGPCGPCSEIFYDHGPEIPGGPPGSPDEDGDRYIEIWNLVFMQFDRASDGTMSPLPKPCVDTGMGLERLAAVLQGVHSNYEIDLFEALIAAAARLTKTKDLNAPSLKVIADHIRACAFLVVDGVLPSNEGRGYVLRRIIRRAIRHGHQLGAEGLFFSEMVEPLSQVMGEAYPELVEKKNEVKEILAKEEERFGETLDQGMGLLNGALAELEGTVIPGDIAFKLYDTYGFPVDLTRDIARERGLTIDEAGFDQAMETQRARARAAGSFKTSDLLSSEALSQLPTTQFLGYDHVQVTNARVVGLVDDQKLVESAEAGQSVVVFLDKTPFYGESGGQVGDCGLIESDGVTIEIKDTQKIAGAFFAHQGQVVSGTITTGQSVTARVDELRRLDIVRHHSATHLLHAALREVLGTHVQQKGSMVAPDRLRFDFSHPQPLSAAEISKVEAWVSDRIVGNVSSKIEEMAYDDAIASGALAFFGDKYGDKVRVVRFGDFSVELCGGTHVERMGDIGPFKIISEGGVSSGVRRIEAVAGRPGFTYMQNRERVLLKAAGLLKTQPEELDQRIEQVLERSRLLEKELDRLKSELATVAGDDLADQAVEINGVSVLSAQVTGMDPGELRTTLDQLKNKLGSAVIVLGSTAEDGVRLVAGVSQDLTATIKAGDLVRHVAEAVGGKGGGRPDFAQAGGPNKDALPDALTNALDWIRAQLG
ncbi:MAG TPA: alanine--tRNA ligase [Wenzhouxiangella sp.]